jgi:hypothetical protein
VERLRAEGIWMNEDVSERQGQAKDPDITRSRRGV